MTEKDIFTFTAKKNYSGTLNFAVIGIAHGHIFSMCEGLLAAGAKMKYVFDGNEHLMAEFAKKYPETEICFTKEEIYKNSDVQLVVTAAVPSQRSDIAVKSMLSGKNVLVDKAPVISAPQLELVRKTIKKTGKKYFVYYGESIDEPSTVYALELVKRGVIGKVLHISGTAPHFLNPASRPEWFWRREHTGGIIIDIGSHQIHQFLRFAGTKDAEIDFVRTDNVCFTKYRGFDESAEFLLSAKNGITGNFYVNWNSPAGLKSWGDPRMVIQGSHGYIELRKNMDIAHSNDTSHIFVVTDDGVFHESVEDKVESNYFCEVISDCVNNTSFINCQIDLKAIEIAINAQKIALSQSI